MAFFDGLGLGLALGLPIGILAIFVDFVGKLCGWWGKD